MAALPFYRSFYPSNQLFYTGFATAALFALSFFIPLLFYIAIGVLFLGGITVLLDTILLYGKKKGIVTTRLVPDRLSNGDENDISIQLWNSYSFSVHCTVIDELPFQFQARNWQRCVVVAKKSTAFIAYTITPYTRGNYAFGYSNVFVAGPLGFVQRRFRSSQPVTIKAYPSFIQMRRYQLAAIGNRIQEAGTKRVRKLGHSMEFEQIKEYVRGDDYRSVNWKATARKSDLMVNAFTDERSQQIYCIINKGRVMKMPFEDMTLLDYAINATLALLNVALRKGDKAGLIMYAEQVGLFVQADKKPAQLNVLLEALYNEQTNFAEPDYEALFATIRNRISQRSLLLVFTNFESVESLERQLPFFKKAAHYHLVMVVFFENTALQTLVEGDAKTIEEIYIKTIAEKYRHEKRLMVKELHKHGIIGLLTTPQNLSVNTINKYLELKNRQSI